MQKREIGSSDVDKSWNISSHVIFQLFCYAIAAQGSSAVRKIYANFSARLDVCNCCWCQNIAKFHQYKSEPCMPTMISLIWLENFKLCSTFWYLYHQTQISFQSSFLESRKSLRRNTPFPASFPVTHLRNRSILFVFNARYDKQDRIRRLIRIYSFTIGAAACNTSFPNCVYCFALFAHFEDSAICYWCLSVGVMCKTTWKSAMKTHCLSPFRMLYYLLLNTGNLYCTSWESNSFLALLVHCGIWYLHAKWWAESIRRWLVKLIRRITVCPFWQGSLSDIWSLFFHDKCSL